MAGHFRRVIAEQVSQILRVPEKELIPHIHAVQVLKKQLAPDFKLFVNSVTKDYFDAVSHKEKAHRLAGKLSSNSVISEIGTGQGCVTFTINRDLLIKRVLHEIAQDGPKYGFNSELLSDIPKGLTLVEYSSPNIAKKFHVGHLRSTIIGNFIANLKEAVGNKVVRMNYLGDWGFQFGLLGAGFSKFGCSEKLRAYPLEHLFEVYVKVNAEAEQDEEMKQCAQDFMQKLENGDPEAVSLWTHFRDLSIEEYSKVYKRLGCQFDEYSGESLYKEKAQDVINLLKSKGLLQKSSNDTGIVDLSKPGDRELSNYSTVMRSDGTSLYITRDIAAAIDRMEKYGFDEMIYVTDKSQEGHFEHLFQILKLLGKEQVDRCQHVMFGRVQGMQTRRGGVIFLEDVLDEARSRMLQNMANTETSKATEDPADVAEKIGIAALIVQDFKGLLVSDYRFNWSQALQSCGDTGVFLQYTHARLHSLLDLWESREEEAFDAVCLQDPCVILTLKHLLRQQLERYVKSALHLRQTGRNWLKLQDPVPEQKTEDGSVGAICAYGAGGSPRYDEVIFKTLKDLQPRYLVSYLMGLGHLANVAHHTLRVKESSPEVAHARLLFFNSIQVVLANGMKVLGITPVDKM